MKQKCDGDMWDWFFLKARRSLSWKAGEGKKIKKRANKQFRKQGKKNLE
jgi:hypothetical protein